MLQALHCVYIHKMLGHELLRCNTALLRPLYLVVTALAFPSLSTGHSTQSRDVALDGGSASSDSLFMAFHFTLTNYVFSYTLFVNVSARFLFIPVNRKDSPK